MLHSPDGRTATTIQQGHFTVLRWNSSDLTVLKFIPAEDAQDVLCISEVEHNSSKSDIFHIQVSNPPKETHFTEHQLLYDISKVFDVLGRYIYICSIDHSEDTLARDMGI